MSEREFVFKIHWPQRLLETVGCQQFFSITAQYPQVVYRVFLKDDERFASEEQQRLAISELKVRLIADIATASFEMENL